MKASISFLYFLILSTISIAQNTFNKSSYSVLLGRCVSKTIDNGFIIGADNGLGGRCYIARFDSAANVVWEKEIGSQNLYMKEIVPVSDSTYLVCMGDSAQIFIAMLNDNGDTLNTNSKSFFGHPDITDGIKTSDGGVILCGSLGYVFTPDEIMLVVKLSDSGVIQWSKTYQSGYLNKFNSIVQLPDSNYLAAGFTLDSLGNRTKGCLIKLSSSGDIIWNKLYFNSQNQDYILSDVIALHDTILLLAPSYGTFSLINSDTTGNILSANDYASGTTFPFVEMELLPDSNLIVSAMTWFSIEYPGSLFKIDRFGNVLFSKQTRVANKLMLFDDGGIMLIGNHFDYLAYEMGLMKGDSLGNGIDCWIQGFNQQPFPDSINEDSTTFITSNYGPSFQSSIQIDPATTMYSPGCVYVIVDYINDNFNFDLFPNPVSNYLTLSFEKEINIAAVYIEDLLGKNQMYFQIFNSSEAVINLSNLIPGCYNIKIRTDSDILSRRFIKIKD